MKTPCFHIAILIAFLVNTLGPMPLAQAQDFRLPAPGVMVNLSPSFNPPILEGIKVHPKDPFRLDFILDKGNKAITDLALKDESSKLIRYFLTSLTIPEKDLWVNLSPYEKNRIIPYSFGLTEMGRDLLAEDYMLKQITASLIYPENRVGKMFWKRVYQEAAKKYGTTNITINTFNKVWILPDKAVVYENTKAGTAYVVESKLKVMLEEDYLSLEKHEGIPLKSSQMKATDKIGSQIVREIVIPQLAKEVNEGKNFSHLRQVYSSLILATWYKKKIKNSILGLVYEDKNKVAGVTTDDPKERQRIYQQYLRAFKKGVFNYIKNEADPITQETIPRRYFSGGEALNRIGDSIEDTSNSAMVIPKIGSQFIVRLNVMDSSMLDRPSDIENPLPTEPDNKYFSGLASDKAMIDSDRLKQLQDYDGIAYLRQMNKNRMQVGTLNPFDTILWIKSLAEHVSSPLVENPLEKLVSAVALTDNLKTAVLKEQKFPIDAIKDGLLGVDALLDYLKKYHDATALQTLATEPNFILEMVLSSLASIDFNILNDRSIWKDRSGLLLIDKREWLRVEGVGADYKDIEKRITMVKAELAYWISQAPRTPQSAVVIVGLAENNNLFGFKFNDGLTAENLLKSVGVDLRQVLQNIKNSRTNSTINRYRPWEIRIPAGHGINISGIDWDYRMKVIKSMIRQRAVFVKSMDAGYAGEIFRRVDNLQRIPALIKDMLKHEPRLQDANIVSIYVTGSYLWGPKIENPTLLDVYVLTDKEIDPFSVNVELPQAIFTSDPSRKPARMEFVVGGSARFLRQERNKVVTHTMGVLIDGADVYGNIQPPAANLLVYANELMQNGRELLEGAEEYFQTHLRPEGIPASTRGSVIEEHMVAGAVKLKRPQNEREAIYYFRKAARRLVAASVVLRDINPLSVSDPQALQRDFVDKMGSIIDLDRLKLAYEQLDGRIFNREGEVAQVRNDLRQTQEQIRLERLIGELTKNAAMKSVFPSRRTGIIRSQHKALAPNGGIDLTAEQMNLQIQNKGDQITFHINPQQLDDLRDAPGFVPAIISIQPAVNLRQFLGINAVKENN